MEENYDYLTTKEDIAGLNEAVRLFMVENDQAHVFRDTYKLTLVRRSTNRWNESKLKKLLPKPIWLKVTKQVVDHHKIDDLVRDGTIDDKLIQPALESTPTAPFIRRYEYKQGQSADDAREEERKLREALTNEATEKAAKPKKRGK